MMHSSNRQSPLDLAAWQSGWIALPVPVPTHQRTGSFHVPTSQQEYIVKITPTSHLQGHHNNRSVNSIATGQMPERPSNNQQISIPHDTSKQSTKRETDNHQVFFFKNSKYILPGGALNLTAQSMLCQLVARFNEKKKEKQRFND